MKLQYRHIICLLGWLLAGTISSLSAQEVCTFSIRGNVIDDHDATPLSYATIRLLPSGQGAISDSTGRYVLTNVCAGTYTLLCSHLGCEDVSKTIVVTKDMQVDFHPEHHEETLNTVAVTAQRAQDLTQTQSTLEGTQLEQQRGKSFSEALEKLSGVAILRSGANISKPILHGLYGNRILIVNQGVRQEDQQWGVEHAPTIDPFSSDKLSVVKGAGALQYGSDALAGVLLAEADPLPTTPDWQGRVYAIGSTNTKGGIIAAQLQRALRPKGLAFRWQGTLKKFGDAQAPQYVLSNTATQETNTSLSIGKQAWKQGWLAQYTFFRGNFGILRASHIGNLTDLERALQLGQPQYVHPFTYAINNPRQLAQHQVVKLEAYRRFSLFTQLTLKYAFQNNRRQEFDIRRGGRSETPAIDLTLHTHSIDARLQHRRTERWLSTAGVQVWWQKNTNIPGTGFQPLIPNFSQQVLGAYFIERFTHQQHTIEAGIRYDYRYVVAKQAVQNKLITSVFNFSNVALNAGWIYALHPQWTWRTNIGFTHRTPTINELLSNGLHHSAATFELGNIQLRNEQGTKIISTLEGATAAQTTTWQLSAYTHHIANFIYLAPAGTQLTVRGAFPVFRYTQTTALLYGIDAATIVRLSPHWQYSATAALVLGEDLTLREPLYQVPPFRWQQQLSYTRRYTATRLSEWSIGLRHTWVARQHRYPDNQDFQLPPSAYQLVGVSAGVQLALRGNQQLLIELAGENLLNAAYRDYLNRFRYFADERGRDVTLKLKYSF